MLHLRSNLEIVKLKVTLFIGVSIMPILKYHIVALAAALGLSSLIFAITLS